MENANTGKKAPETNLDDVRKKNQLKRVLPTSVGIAIGIGTAVGSGIFTTVGEVAAASGCALFVVLSFILGGLKQIPEALFYAEVSTAFPQNGAAYRYFERAGWRYLAFLSGCINFLGSDPPRHCHHRSCSGKIRRILPPAGRRRCQGRRDHLYSDLHVHLHPQHRRRRQALEHHHDLQDHSLYHPDPDRSGIHQPAVHQGPRSSWRAGWHYGPARRHLVYLLVL